MDGEVTATGLLAVMSASTHDEVMRRARNGEMDAFGVLATYEFRVLPNEMFGGLPGLAGTVKVEGEKGV